MKSCSRRLAGLTVTVLSILFAIYPLATAQAASISGTVTGPDGTTPLPNILVESANVSSWDWGSSAYTDSNGQYELAGLVAGTYHVRFSDDSGTYVAEVHDDILGTDFWNSGTGIVLGEAAAISGINASLAIASRITGKVTGPDGLTGLDDIFVEAYRWNGSWWNRISYTWTDGNGDYKLGGLGAGTYRVAFSDDGGEFVGEVFDSLSGTDPWNGGNSISVGHDETISDIDASLAIASKITGQVTGPDGLTGLQGIYVVAYRQNGSGWSWTSSANTDTNGDYELGGLAAGTYRVAFSGNGYYADEVYDNIPGWSAWAYGTEIGVPESSTVAAIDASLVEYASVSGTVTQDDGLTPISGVLVVLTDGAGNWESSDWTDAEGNYQITQVYPGSHTLRAEPWGQSGYLGQWYGDVLYVPGEEEPPPGVTVIALGSGQSQTGVDFALMPAGRITGEVTADGGVPVVGGYVKAKNATYGLVFSASTDDTGAYELMGLLPGTYTLKAGADRFRDEWWSDVTHEDFATTFPLASGDDLVFDFELFPGQSPALVEVRCDPEVGAAIYLDYQATTNVTPAVLDVGESGMSASHSVWVGGALGQHVITVKKTGYPWPVPQFLEAAEAETVSVTFDMTSPAAGSATITTIPDGSSVFIDEAVSGGVTPITVGNLAPGSHTILLRQTGYLQPRPITAWIGDGQTNVVTVPLVPNTSPARVIADVRSTPAGATIYVDYLPTTNLTDEVVDWMDPASHSGVGWHSASHAILLRRPGYLPSAPRFVPDATNDAHAVYAELIIEPVADVDADHDGMPDPWEDAYRLRELAPSENGADDDPDGDGSSNEEERRAGTNPMDENSVLDLENVGLTSPGVGQTVTFIFSTLPGKLYVIRSAETLMSPWYDLSTTIQAKGYLTSYTTAIPDGQRKNFYRLVVLGP